jgi:hypothetical protein
MVGNSQHFFDRMIGNWLGKKNAQYENCVFTGSAKEYLWYIKYNILNYQFLCLIFIKFIFEVSR